MLAELQPSQKNYNRKIWVVTCNSVSQNYDYETPITIVGEEIILKHLNYRFRVKSIIIDEFQDSPDYFVDWLIRAKECIDCEQLTIALDSNQSIFRMSNNDNNSRLFIGFKTYNLSFCYRMTKPLLDNAFSVLSRYAVQYSNTFEIGTGFQIPVALIGGPKVRYIAVSNTEQLVAKAKKCMLDLERQYENGESLVLIHLQYWSPHFAKRGKLDLLAEELKNDEEIGKYYRFAASTKGKEYFAGVIVCPRDFFAIDRGKDNIMRLNTLYVSLTRMRDELVFIYVDGTPVLPYLPLE